MSGTALPVFDPSGRAVLAFARNELAAGGRAAIVSLAAISGSAPRSVGAQMCVAEDGRFTGAISSGCLERAIVDEARAALSRGRGSVLRYGANSPFKDIVLPCGSGLDLLFTIDLRGTALDEAVARLDLRAPVALRFSPAGIEWTRDGETAFAGGTFTRRYLPRLRIAAAGVGAELVQFARVALAAGYAFTALSPDEATLAACAGAETVKLTSGGALPEVQFDPWTAVALMFHDREWERALAPAALASPAFYVGAVGSRRTAAARRRMFLEDGVDEAALDRLRGPIGLAPAMRDPSALALSVLAEIANAWADRWER